jgi:hypothetical protein
MDPAIAGHPVFMLIAYPSKSKDGNRQKMILYFHIPPKREDSAVTQSPVATADNDLATSLPFFYLQKLVSFHLCNNVNKETSGS